MTFIKIIFAVRDVEGAQKSLVMSGRRTEALLAGFSLTCGASYNSDSSNHSNNHNRKHLYSMDYVSDIVLSPLY